MSQSLASGSTLPEVRQALSDMAAESAELRRAVGGPVADTLAEWLAAQYVLAARRLVRDAGEDGLDLRTLAALNRDLVALRQGDHSAARLAIDRERLELERQRTEERMRVLFEEWLAKPEVTEKLLGKSRTAEERERRLREIFGLSQPASRGLSPEALSEIESALRVL